MQCGKGSGYSFFVPRRLPLMKIMIRAGLPGGHCIILISRFPLSEYKFIYYSCHKNRACYQLMPFLQSNLKIPQMFLLVNQLKVNGGSSSFSPPPDSHAGQFRHLHSAKPYPVGQLLILANPSP
jgi:hypothetical protein